MFHTHTCPKCGQHHIVRIPDQPRRYASQNNIYLSTMTLAKKVPVIHYVCTDCGYVEEWVENPADLKRIQARFG